MLIFKADKDLKELEKFGFRPKYDEYTGEINAYEKITEKYEGVVVRILTEPKRIRIYKNKLRKRWELTKYADYYDIDTLYDLIKEDLVEKVGE